MINDPLKKRWLLFLFICILSRLLLVYTARFGKKETLVKFMGFLSLFPAFGFAYLWFTNGRQVGMETGGNRIWWSNYRILHALCYFTFAVLAIQENPNAYLALAADVTIGLSLFFLYHGTKLV